MSHQCVGAPCGFGDRELPSVLWSGTLGISRWLPQGGRSPTQSIIPATIFLLILPGTPQCEGAQDSTCWEI